MKVDDILSHIDLGLIALPVFQRGYVWNREQVRKLFTSLYRDYPVGGLLLWATQSGSVAIRGEVAAAVAPVRMLLDGQQRITSLYGVIRGHPPPFFDGDGKAFTGLHFHLEDELFEFYQPAKMQSDPAWIDVTKVMQAREDEVTDFVELLASDPRSALKYVGRLGRLRGIRGRNFQEEEIPSQHQSLEEVVDIFNLVNSGGTKLSAGDLALARICAAWPEAREEMQAHLRRWAEKGYDRFSLDWLLRSVNTILTGEARVAHLQGQTADEIKDGLARAAAALDYALTLVGDRLGLDSGKVLFGRNAFPLMAHYIDRRGRNLAPREQGLLLYWYVSGAMRGRFSGTIDSVLDEQLAAVEDLDGGLDRLVDQLELWAGRLEVDPNHFDAATSSSRFYPVLYMLTRIDGARDFCSGVRLKEGLLGSKAQLEVHHIFPKAQLRKHGYHKREINALANFCFLTEECNRRIRATPPEIYFGETWPEYLESQWIPASDEPWTLDRYPEFLEARRQLMADAVNRVLSDLRDRAATEVAPLPSVIVVSDEDEQVVLAELGTWVAGYGLSEGEPGYEVVAADGSDDLVTLDLAWPEGLQRGLSTPVAVVIDEPPEVIEAANAAGFRCFTDPSSFRRYVEAEVLSR